jgi:hypothetical protein
MRELDPLSKSRIFALGDSFVFGYGTEEGKTWPDLLGAALGEPVYNLGVSSTGPRPQLELLKYMLQTYRDSMHVKQLLWMLFEGNDLENSYEVERHVPPAAAPGVGTLLEGTAVQALLSIPVRIRDESFLRRLLRGDVTLGRDGNTSGAEGIHEIDGVRLPLPLFHSRRFGYSMFNSEDVARATKPRDYVLNHPNRPLLDQTFREMRELSERLGFEVTVIIAPSDARLYGAAFDGFPMVTEEPYFVDYLIDLAGRTGFRVINLLSMLRPYAESEYLYYRDDHHWNVRGNLIVAKLLEQTIRPH